MLFTLAGIVMLVKNVHFLKACDSNLTTPFGISTVDLSPLYFVIQIPSSFMVYS